MNAAATFALRRAWPFLRCHGLIDGGNVLCSVYVTLGCKPDTASNFTSFSSRIKAFMIFSASDRRAIKLPTTRATRKPSDMVYSSLDRPPRGALIALAGQHAIMAIALSAYALAAAKLGGLSVSQTQIFLSCSILGMALSTLLQAWGGRIGAGALLVHIPGPILVPFVAVVLKEYGVGGMLMLSLATGLPAIGLSRLIPHLRSLFPPTVLGVIVCMGGFSLIQGAALQSLGLNETFAIDGISALIAGTTLSVIVALSVWGNSKMKLFGLAAGIVAGVAVAGLCGRLTGGDLFATVPIVALPSVPLPVFNVAPGLLAVIVIVGLLGQFDTFASTVIVDRMDDADWHRPDMKMAGGGVMANAIGDMVTGLLGGMPTATSSANIGLAHATRSTSRWIGIVAGVLMAIVALLPQATLALTLIPTPVIGAIQVYAAAFLIVSGLELATSRVIDSRGVFMIGLSLFIGIAVMIIPQLADGVPEWARHFLGSGFVMAGVVAILLNGLFRIGTSIEASRSLDEADLSTSIVEFIEKQGGKWAARREIVSRAALAAMETTELIMVSGKDRRPTAIRARFDEFNFDVEIIHSGPQLTLGITEAPDVSTLLDADEDAIDRAMANISMVLVQRLADRVRVGMRDGHASVLLHFDH
jgi:xanthine/uracil permease